MKQLTRGFREPGVDKAASAFRQDVFHYSKAWPREERYAMTDQVRRSSPSVGAHLAEAGAKREYPAHFLCKLTDADGELQETLHWLQTAAECGYVTRMTSFR